MTPRILKITTFGTRKSGKTSIARRMVGKEVTKDYAPTIFVDYLTAKKITDPLKPAGWLTLQIWDTSMALENPSLSYLKGCDVIFYVIDATAESLAEQFDKIRSTLHRPAKNTELILILTKTDLISKEEQKIKVDAVKTFMDVEIHHHQFTFYAVSATNDRGMTRLIEDTLKRVPTLSDADKANKLYNNQRETIHNVCDTYTALTKKRFYFSTDLTRNATVRNLSSTIDEAKSHADIIAALVEAVKDIRKPTETNRRKYGLTFFLGFLHYGSYKNSELYKLIKAELTRLDPTIINKLDDLTKPVKTSYRNAPVYPLKRV